MGKWSMGQTRSTGHCKWSKTKSIAEWAVSSPAFQHFQTKMRKTKRRTWQWQINALTPKKYIPGQWGAQWCQEPLVMCVNIYIYIYVKKHGVGKRARTFPPDAEDTLWRHISKTCGATLFGATLFGDATFSCDATFWRCIVWRHIVWWRHIFLWRHILAPHCLAPHCLATPHFPVTPHFGATLFGATLFGDATFSCDATFWRRILWRHIVWWRHIGGCYVASVAWSWLEWFRLGVGSVGKNAPGTGCIFGSMVGPHLCRPSKLGWASWHILVLRWAIGKTPNTKCGLWSETIVSGTLLHRFTVFSVFSLYFHYGFTFLLIPLLTFYASYYSTLLVVHFSFHSTRLI